MIVKNISFVSFLTFLIITFFVFLGIYCLQPPRPVPLNAPLTEFSSGRALRDLEVIAQNPHPTGSPESARVQAYISRKLSELGFEPEIQETTSVDQIEDLVCAGTVRNIIARLEGADDKGKAILLVAHYDSVSTGPGASDNGAAVVTLLETARALKAGSPLKNDVIFLFSDGEEVAALGAAAFINKHPWAKEIGLVINLEARGTSGPSIMYETSANNGWLIEEFAKAVPYPISNSLAYEVYKLLPTFTDFTIFREAGLAGFNLAFIKGSVYYHSSLDTIENLDESSLQHHGSYTLALTRHFGNLPLESPNESQEVYFDILGLVLVHYPQGWVIPVTMLTILLFVGVAVLGFRRKRLTLAGMTLGFFAFMSNILAVSIIVELTWQIICAWHSGYKSFPGDTYNSDLYIMSFVTLAIAVTSFFYVWLRKKTGIENLAFGGLLWWLILTVLSSLYLPGASYLFTWPLLFSLIGLGFTFILKNQGVDLVKRFILLSVCAIPGIVLLVPTTYLVFTALTLTGSSEVMVMVTLLLGLLLPQLEIITIQNKWLLPATSALISLGFIIAGSLTSGFDVHHPKPSGLFYALNANTKEALWVSPDPELDEWTSQFIATDVTKGLLPDYGPFSDQEYLQSPAPSIMVSGSDLALLNSSANDNSHTLNLRLTSPQQVSFSILYVTSKAQILGAVVGGKQVNIPIEKVQMGAEQKYLWELLCWGTCHEGLDLKLKMESPQPVEIKVVDHLEGLPEIPGFRKARPDYMTSPRSPSGSDMTIVGKTFTY